MGNRHNVVRTFSLCASEKWITDIGTFKNLNDGQSGESLGQQQGKESEKMKLRLSEKRRIPVVLSLGREYYP